MNLFNDKWQLVAKTDFNKNILDFSGCCKYKTDEVEVDVICIDVNKLPVHNAKMFKVLEKYVSEAYNIPLKKAFDFIFSNDFGVAINYIKGHEPLFCMGGYANEKFSNYNLKFSLSERENELVEAILEVINE